MTNDNVAKPAWACFACQFDGAVALCRQADGSHAFEALADAYLKAGGDEGLNDLGHQATDCLDEMVAQAPDAAVGFLVIATQRCADLEALCYLAAGPLENLLDAHGPRIISKLEQIAKVEPKFRLMLSGTWGKTRIDPDVWTRLVAAVAPGPVIDAEGRTPAAGMNDKIATKSELGVLFRPRRQI
jgi:hypothetical protein